MELPTVDGRECVPVRLLPFMTDWLPLSPDVVAKLFSGRDSFGRAFTMSSFQLHPNGRYTALKQRSWDAVDNDLETLATDLKRREEFEFQLEREWRESSINRLPAAVFVWKDELIAEYERIYTRRVKFLNTRPGDGELSFAPYVPPEQMKVVLEGFDYGPRASDSSDPGSSKVGQADHAQAVTETPEERQDRRLRELRQSGGDYQEVNNKWRVMGPRGLLAQLIRREKAAGRPMSDGSNVRQDLKAAASRDKDARKIVNSVFDRK